MTQKEKETQNLVRHSLWSLVGYIAYFGINVIALPFYLRWLGDAHYGLFTLLLSIVAPLGILTVGIGQATTKLVATAIAGRDLLGAAQAIRSNLAFNFLIGTLGALIIFLSAPAVSRYAFNMNGVEASLFEQCMAWTGGSWFAIQISGTFTSALIGFKRFRTVALGTAVSSAVATALGLFVLYNGSNLTSVIIVRTAVGVVSCAIWYVICWNAVGQQTLSPRFYKDTFRTTLHFGSWQTVSSFISQMGAQADRLMLGRYVSLTAVGLLSVPQLMYSTVYAVVSKLGDSMFPSISTELALNRPSGALQILVRSGPFLSLAMVTLQGTLYILASDAISLYLHSRSDVVVLSNLLRLMSLAAIISSPSIPIQQYLLGSGAVRSLTLISLASTLGTVVAAVVLVPIYGLQGAALGNLLSVLTTRPLMHYLVWRRHLRSVIGFGNIFFALYGISFLGIGISLALGAFRDWLAWSPSWLISPFAGAITMFITYYLTTILDRTFPGGLDRANSRFYILSYIFAKLCKKSGSV